MSLSTYQHISKDDRSTSNHVRFTFENGLTLSVQSGTVGYVDREAVTHETDLVENAAFDFGLTVRMSGENHEIAFMLHGDFVRPLKHARRNPADFAHDDVLGRASTDELAWYMGQAPNWVKGVDYATGGVILDTLSDTDPDEYQPDSIELACIASRDYEIKMQACLKKEEDN